MPDITFHLDKERSEQDNALVIKLSEAISLAQMKKITSEKDAAAISFLLQEEQRFQKRVSGKTQDPLQFFHVSFPQGITALKLLTVTGKLYFNNKTLVCDFFGKVTFQEVEEQIAGKTYLAGKLHYQSSDIDVRECDWICQGPPHWFIKGISLRIISSETAWSEIRQALSPQAIIAYDPLPVLRLKDRVGAFADLFMTYPLPSGDFFEISYENPTSQVISKTGKNICKRQQQIEKSWENDLLETAFIRKAVGSSNYYCPIDKVAKSLVFLIELGWQVFDWQGKRVYHQTAIDLNLNDWQNSILVKGKVRFNEFEANIQDVIGAFNRKENFLQIGTDSVGLLANLKEDKQLEGLLEEGEIISEGIKMAKSRFGSMQELFNTDHGIHVESGLKDLGSKLANFQGIPQALPGDGFMGSLRPYQQLGVNWLAFLHSMGLHGLLADDMGLGKTVQVLAFLSRHPIEKPILIVLPTSLIFNWKYEIAQFLPHVHVVVHHGPNRAKSEQVLNQKQIILTSYTTLRMDLPLLKNIIFSALILDEAQAIKNAQTQTALALYSMQADFRLSITGTPIENHLREVWAHFRFLIPDLFDDEKSFESDLLAAQSDSRYLQRIKKKIKPFILRRKKEEVAQDLPEKIEQIVWITMSPEQQNVYDTFLQGVRSGLIKKVHAEGMGKHRMEVFEAILRLRQICCHPLLVSEKLEHSEALLSSAKLEALLDDMEVVLEEGRKAIVYSQFTSMLKLISKEAYARQWNFAYLDGATQNREKVVRQFQEDSETPFFLVSLKAGGTGLNLTAADYVFLFDPWWNDAVENQAINRAHRMGRHDTVIAKRFITYESIEEKMLKLKKQKQTLITDLLSDEFADNNLTEDDLLFLLN